MSSTKKSRVSTAKSRPYHFNEKVLRGFRGGISSLEAKSLRNDCFYCITDCIKLNCSVNHKLNDMTEILERQQQTQIT